MAGDPIDGTEVPASHYDRLGGAPTIKEAVDRFYKLVLADPSLAPYFTHADLSSVKRHQVLLLSQVLDGPAHYEGRALGETHRSLDITSEAYDRVVAHLVSVLTELGADDEAIAAAGEVVAGVKPDIVGGSAGDA